MGKHKRFAALLPEWFSPAELAYIRSQTACGPSALDVVRSAVRAAAKVAEERRDPERRRQALEDEIAEIDAEEDGGHRILVSPVADFSHRFGLAALSARD